MKKFFDALPQSSGTTPLISAVGTCLRTDKEAIFKRWTEPFYSVLSSHLSMMKLSTDYYRWNVLRCLRSSKPSLKQ